MYLLRVWRSTKSNQGYASQAKKESMLFIWEINMFILLAETSNIAFKTKYTNIHINVVSKVK